MHFLVDGHNLIPKIPGLSLRDLEDERRLIRMLQEYCRLSRNSAEVYFDQAAPGSVRIQQYGTIKAHFIQSGITADQAIIARLQRLGKAAANWTVISSDRRVQVEARALRARVMTSENFARRMLKQLEDSSNEEVRNVFLKEQELSEWLKVFDSEGKEDT